MDKQIFERNVLALSKTDPRLCARLSAAVTTEGIYRFINSRTGDLIPALTERGGAARPLHSIVDPRREGARLVGTLAEEGYIVFLGLGGAFAPEAALKRSETQKVLVIEYGCNGVAELFGSRDYLELLQDPRFRLLLDPSGDEVEACLLNTYTPATDGGIRVFPLRTRTGPEERFNRAGEAIKRAIDAVSRDYSVQAFFGKRWFSNIIRNLSLAEAPAPAIPPIRQAAVCAAGPSLDTQFPLIKKNRNNTFLIACDTSLPALLSAGIEPDGVISIDCQQISYRHFFKTIPPGTKLFLDLSSPPTVAAGTENRFFFSGGHPLGLFICREWRPFPVLDSSGANVTYAALSLALLLGAETITFYGADFSYPGGKTYARGTYIYPYFENLQSRYKPLESLHSAFLYRDSSLQKHEDQNRGGPENWYYDTQPLRFYRETVHRRAASSGVTVENLAGLPRRGASPGSRKLSLLAPGPARRSAADFLVFLRESIGELTGFDGLSKGAGGERELLTTLLPLAAAIRRNSAAISPGELFQAVKAFSLQELSRIIHS
ncbi:MAG: DUF115 domain-containing protein [Spirochaetaceae bacterium]|jgi:hypothetical protein|nr:DUF115 domain-containing protein [Spirochaetaceae bacterium]